MAPKHTIGQWKVSKGGFGLIEVETEWRDANNHRNIIAQMAQRNITDEETIEANAKLISAAPELLEALEMILNETNAGTWDCLPVVKAKAAIAKAKGE